MLIPPVSVCLTEFLLLAGFVCLGEQASAKNRASALLQP